MYDLSLRQMEIFLAAAASLHFSEAARAFHITPSAVSKSIKNLENELGAPLFTRIGKQRLELTPQGEQLRSHWEGALREVRRGIEEMHRIGSELRGELRIGCLNGFDYNGFLPELIHGFSQAHPAVAVSVHAYGFRELREHLLGGGADLIVTADFSVDGLPGVAQLPVEALKLYIALSRAHPLASRETLCLADLRDQVFYQISPEEAELAGKKASNACRRAGFTPKAIEYVPNIPSLAMAVKHGAGCTICGDEIYHGNEKYIKLYRTGDLPPDADTILAWRPAHASPAVLAFVELARASKQQQAD